MAGTVRGAFDLDVGPAVRGVREYRREAARADVQTKQLGATIDRSFSRQQVQQIERVGTATERLARDTHRSRMQVRQEWEGMRRDIQREGAQIVSTIAVVRDRMRQLGRERVSPQIDLDGVSRAIAQVELLQLRLAQLGNARVTPRVGMGGGFTGGGQSAAAAAGGAGRGGGSAILNLGGVGFAGVRGGTLLAAGALGLPAVQSVIGGGAALGGSLGSAAVGGGAAALGGLAPLVAGIGAIMSVAKPANESLKEVWKAQDAFTKAVREHGRASEQAQAAERELARLRRRAGPGAGYASSQARAFGREWRQLTRPARQQYYGLLGDTAQIGRRVAPLLAQNATTATTALRGSGTDFARFMAGGAMQDDLGFFTRSFARELPTAERTLENMVRTMSNLARASTPFFHEANVWVRETTGGWRSSTRDIAATRREIEPMVESAKLWADLTGDTFSLLKNIASMGRPSGDSLVADLDRTIERWDAWITTHPTETRRWFSDTADSVRDMAGALRGAVGWLDEMASALRPLLDRFSQLVELASSLGLIGTPGAIAGVIGGYRGIRGSMGGGGGMAGGGGQAAVVGGAVAGGMTARGMAGRAAAGGAGRAGQLVYGSGFRYGAPVSQLGARTTMFGRGMNAVGAGARGAARGFWPVALGLGALDFATFNGDVMDRAQAALSGATFGLVNRPLTGEQRHDRSIGLAQEAIAGLPQGRSIGGQRAAIRELERMARFGSGSDAVGERGGDPRKYADVLREELTTRRQLVREMERERTHRLDETSRQRATQYAAGLGGAFRTYRRAGRSPAEAMDATVGQVRERMGKMRDAGVETLGEASLAWARELARKNPALTKQVDDLTDSIRRRFRRMGKDVQIVNGDILTGSKAEWKQIRDAMSGSVETARQRMMEDFTAIQNKAVGSLIAMGFSRGEAKKLVQGQEDGSGRGAAAMKTLERTGSTYEAGITLGTRAGPAAPKKARGGMIGGRGLMDTVPVPGGLAAPGEGWIANRHTMEMLSQATRAVHGLTAQQIISGETRPHWMPRRHARGGQIVPVPGFPGEMAASSILDEIAYYTRRFGLRLTDAFGPGHQSPGHTKYGTAADFAGPDRSMDRAVAMMVRRGFKVLYDGRFGSTAWPGHGPSTVAGSNAHIHVEFGSGSGAAGNAPAGGMGGGGMGRVRIRGVGRRQPGVPGALRQRGGDIFAAGLQRRVNRAIGAMDGGGGGDLSGFSGGGSAAANMRLGHQMMLRLWGEGEWPSLRELWTRESGWSNTARNPSSGAFGIPQSLPASKMGAAAVGGDAAAQIRWGLRYIRGRYGSPSAALAFHNAHNWYERGGRLKWAGAFDRGGSFVTDGPTAFVAGEGPRNRRERVKITPATGGGGDGVMIHFGPGSVVVQVGGAGGGVSDAEADRIGQLVAKKIIEAIDKGRTTGVIG